MFYVDFSLQPLSPHTHVNTHIHTHTHTPTHPHTHTHTNIDLSKTFNFLSRKLTTINRLNAYHFTLRAPKLIHNLFSKIARERERERERKGERDRDRDRERQRERAKKIQ